MPSHGFNEQAFKGAAAMLRAIADILEQQPEEVASLNYTMSTNTFRLGGIPFEREYHVIIRTHLKREQT